MTPPASNILDPHETLLEPADVGRALDVTSAQIRRLTDQGHLVPVARTVRGTRLYRRADVDRLVESRRAGQRRTDA
jgi:DNA-binding transcriptional MerR regulator